MNITLSINAVPVVLYTMLRWSVTLTINGIGMMRFQVLSQDGIYHADLDALVTLTDTDHGVILFAGPITSISEAGLADKGVTPFLSTITAHDYNSWASRRYVTVSIPAGTLKAALLLVVGYVTPQPLHISQVNGPSLPALEYRDMKSVDVLNDLALQAGGWVWSVNNNQVLRMEAPTTNAATFNIIQGAGCLAVGDIEVEPTRENYANRVLVRSTLRSAEANDVAEQTLRGYWETLVTVPDDTTQAAMDAMAIMILAQSLPILKRVRYTTRQYGLTPGKTQTITASKRNLNNTFLVTDVTIRGDDKRGPDYDVTAIEGSAIPPGWRDTYKSWGGGSSGSVVASGGGGGGTGVTRFAYFLGGNGLDATSSPTPTWVPASGGGVIGQGAIQVQINTVPRGTTAATIVARLRALDAAVGVSARLYNVTDSVAAAGTSSVVTSTSWTTVTWGVTLTAGAKYYELQLLPTVANAPVIGTGYLE